MSLGFLIRLIFFGGILYLLTQCAFRAADPVAQARHDEQHASEGLTHGKWNAAVNAFISKVDDYGVQDPELVQCIKDGLRVYEGAIVSGDLTEPSHLSSMDCSRRGIEQLAGIERFTQLQRLNLSGNPISFLQPLNKLQQLRYLDLSETKVDSLWMITNLDKVETLRLVGTPLAEIDSLLDFAALRKVDIYLGNNFKCTDLESFFGELSRNHSFYVQRPGQCIDSYNNSVRF